MEHKYCVKMPAYGSTAPMLEMAINIDHKQNNVFEPYSIDSEIYYDFPILDFGMHVTKAEHLEEDESPDEDAVDKTETLLSS